MVTGAHYGAFQLSLSRSLAYFYIILLKPLACGKLCIGLGIVDGRILSLSLTHLAWFLSFQSSNFDDSFGLIINDCTRDLLFLFGMFVYLQMWLFIY